MNYENFDKAKELVRDIDNLNIKLGKLDQVFSIEIGTEHNNVYIDTTDADDVLNIEADKFIKSLKSRLEHEIAKLKEELYQL
jgi:hypothetical protein